MARRRSRSDAWRDCCGSPSRWASVAGARRIATAAPGRRLALALTIGAVLLIVACGLQAARVTLAELSPETALRIGLADADALSAVAEAREADARRPGHDAEASRYAEAALRAAPLDARAVRVLGLEAEKAGGATRARILMVIADRWSRRDTAAQLWLFQQAMMEGDWPNASLHADALLRRHWRLANVLYPAMASALRDPAAVGPFVQRLGEAPDWRHSFLSALAWHAPDPAVPARLFLALAASPIPPTDEDSSNLIGRYVAQGDYTGARALWLRLLPRAAAPAKPLLYNGDFRPLPGAAPFNWRLIQSEGATAETLPAADGAPALHVLGPAAKDAAAAEELVSLPPGAYRLTGRALVEPGLTGDLFAWRISCAAQPGNPIAEARQSGGPGGWRAFTVDFQVGPGCQAQWLRLEGLAHTGFQPAEAWYRGLSVQGLAAPPAASQGSPGAGSR